MKNNFKLIACALFLVTASFCFAPGGESGNSSPKLPEKEMEAGGRRGTSVSVAPALSIGSSESYTAKTISESSISTGQPSTAPFVLAAAAAAVLTVPHSADLIPMGIQDTPIPRGTTNPQLHTESCTCSDFCACMGDCCRESCSCIGEILRCATCNCCCNCCEGSCSGFDCGECLPYLICCPCYAVCGILQLLGGK